MKKKGKIGKRAREIRGERKGGGGREEGSKGKKGRRKGREGDEGRRRKRKGEGVLAYLITWPQSTGNNLIHTK